MSRSELGGWDIVCRDVGAIGVLLGCCLAQWVFLVAEWSRMERIQDVAEDFLVQVALESNDRASLELEWKPEVVLEYVVPRLV